MAETPETPRRRLAVWPLVLTWMAVPFQCAVFLLPITGFHILHSFGARRRHAWLSVVASPAFVLATGTALWAAVGYASGSARLHFAGLPGPAFYNLDPEYRCYRSTSGCVVFPDTPCYHGIHNAVLRALVKRGGPMKGSWTGGYPTEAEALAALAKPEGTLNLEGRRLEDAQEELGFPIRNDAPGAEWRLSFFAGERVRWSTVAGDVLAFETTRPNGKTSVLLVSRSRGEAFALYQK